MSLSIAWCSLVDAQSGNRDVGGVGATIIVVRTVLRLIQYDSKRVKLADGGEIDAEHRAAPGLEKPIQSQEC